MVDLKATNLKLKQRAKNILRYIGGAACTQSDEELEAVLEECRGSVKLAAATIVLGIPVADAEERLQKNKGVLARVFEAEAAKQAQQDDKDKGLFLCVDAGGTSCKAVIRTRDGHSSMGVSGPCNVYAIPLFPSLPPSCSIVE